MGVFFACCWLRQGGKCAARVVRLAGEARSVIYDNHPRVNRSRSLMTEFWVECRR